MLKYKRIEVKLPVDELNAIVGLRPSTFVSEAVEFLSIQIGTAGSGDASILA